MREAIESATGTVSNYARDAAESLTSNAEQAKDSVYDAASGAAAAAGIAYQPREDRRESRPYGGDRNGRDGGRERRPFDNNRGSERGGYADKPRPERVLTPNSSIYVGNLLFDITSADIQKEFEEFGAISKITIASDARGLSKGYDEHSLWTSIALMLF